VALEEGALRGRKGDGGQPPGGGARRTFRTDSGARPTLRTGPGAGLTLRIGAGARPTPQDRAGARPPLLHHRRSQHDGEPDEEEHQREGRDPGGEPRRPRELAHHLEHHPPGHQVHPQDLPEGSAMGFHDQVLQALHSISPEKGRGIGPSWDGRGACGKGFRGAAEKLGPPDQPALRARGRQVALPARVGMPTTPPQQALSG